MGNPTPGFDVYNVGHRGYFGIGICGGKTAANVGTLWRTAYQLGASFIFTAGARYPKQASDTVKAQRHIPLYQYGCADDLSWPTDCVPIAIEMGGRSLQDFTHPERAVYFLGAEDNGLPRWALERCAHTVSLPALRTQSFNVAVAGALVMYDRLTKQRK